MTTQADTNAAVCEREERREDELAFNNALCGRDSGSDKYNVIKQRIDRKQQEQEAEKQRLTALEMLLLDDEYRAAWQNAMNAINRARDAVNDALARAKTELEAAQQAHNLLMENAATFGDEAVFLDEDGYFYTMDGEQLSDDDMLLVNAPENPTMRAAIEDSADRLASAQERYAFVSGKDQELSTVEQKAHDPDKPIASIQGLDSILKESEALRRSVVSIEEKDHNFVVTHVDPAKLPALDGF
jgi:hypothetical protein